MKGYGSFCPIAKAAEILSERWTLLVVRELLLGSKHFNEIRRGVPRMSTALLSKRLRTLQDCGLVESHKASNGSSCEYGLTKAGEDLRQLIEIAGAWGQRWVRSKLERDELDPGELMWYIHRHFDASRMPRGKIVIEITFTDVKHLKRWWLLSEDGQFGLCLKDPGFDVDMFITADLLSLTQVYIGDLSLNRACTEGKIEVDGPRELVRSMPEWFARSRFADVNSIIR